MKWINIISSWKNEVAVLLHFKFTTNNQLPLYVLTKSQLRIKILPCQWLLTPMCHVVATAPSACHSRCSPTHSHLQCNCCDSWNRTSPSSPYSRQHFTAAHQPRRITALMKKTYYKLLLPAAGKLVFYTPFSQSPTNNRLGTSVLQRNQRGIRPHSTTSTPVCWLAIVSLPMPCAVQSPDWLGLRVRRSSTHGETFYPPRAFFPSQRSVTPPIEKETQS